ncbi:BON domain-containing protein [uncultured Desulfobacter sp.]|uniref:BON domain-containing protein n=1 Tax=uncultured Desulfobacter sp. TaxID=240139 RepID=UPI002AAAE33F|nr:BON domain-containing protein [uncultured Desulfobacter sp.]
MPKKSDYTTKYAIVCAFVLFLMSGCASQNPNAGSPVYYQLDSEQRTRSPVTFVSDTVLMARVKSKFMSDDMVNDEGIHVKVRHGVVYLDGCVADIYQRRMAQDLAGSIDGVVQVISRLKVTNPGTVFMNTDIR